jgi:hypothetical protein
MTRETSRRRKLTVGKAGEGEKKAPALPELTIIGGKRDAALIPHKLPQIIALLLRIVNTSAQVAQAKGQFWCQGSSIRPQTARW